MSAFALHVLSRFPCSPRVADARATIIPLPLFLTKVAPLPQPPFPNIHSSTFFAQEGETELGTGLPFVPLLKG
jgi:hypothetical protein